MTRDVPDGYYRRTHHPDVAAYRSWLIGQGLAANTVRMRVWFAASRLEEWGTWDRSPEQLVLYLHGYDAWTRRTYECVLRSLYIFLTEVGLVAVNPTITIRPSKMPRPQPKPLSQAELDRVLAAADPDMYAWLILASKAGLRLHEIAKVRGEDIDAFGITVLGKGNRLERLPAHPLIRELAERYPSRGWWFPSPWGHKTHRSVSGIGNMVREHFRAHGIESGSVHRCRATYGTQLARSGVSMRVVQDLMRHSSLATTQLYLGVDEDERLAAISNL